MVLGTGCGVFRGGGADPLEWSEARLLQDEEAFDTAAAELQTRWEGDAGEPYWPHRLAELEQLRGRDDLAEPLLRSALDLDPGYAPSLTLLSDLLYREGRHYEAIDLLEPAVEAGSPGEVRAALALHLVATGEVGAAESCLRPLESRGEHWAAVGSVLTYVRLQGESYREAPRWAERALEANESAANCNNYGIALLQEGDPAAARDYFERALKLDPEQVGALYNLAIVEKFYFFDDEAAQAYYRRFASRSAEDPDDLRAVFGEPPVGRSEVVEENR